MGMIRPLIKLNKSQDQKYMLDARNAPMSPAKERGTRLYDSSNRLGGGDCLFMVRPILGALGGNMRETSRIHERGNGEDRT